jgi:hypothetical protein
MSPVKIVLKHKDTLSRHGYHDVKTLSVKERRAALSRAVAELGPTYVIRKLNVLAIYNKNKAPRLAARFRADMRFVQKVRDAKKLLTPQRKRVTRTLF